MQHLKNRSTLAVFGLMILLLPGCQQKPSGKSFATPEAAAEALLQGLKSNDVKELDQIFGEGSLAELSSGDPISARHDREVYGLAMQQSWRWTPLGADRKELVIGEEQWPFPFPLAKVGEGWQFDSEAGKKEVLARRIGSNELGVIDVCRAYVDMQREYASQPRDGKLAGLYAQRIRSTPGRQDGLYWSTGPSERPSPLGDLVAEAASEGYDEGQSPTKPFWGYHFRILTAQGAAANGGAKSYLVNDELTGGFALVAYPAVYGRGGVMTFIVSHDGTVYEKDLGEETPKLAAGIAEFNPDSSWTEVKGPQS